MFIDRAVIFVKAGNGGHGIVAFHREKYIAAGGPDGGDGGKGGDVIFVADESSSTLADFRYKRKYAAQAGENGKKNKMTGKSGDDLVVKVPCGTLVKDSKTGRILADMVIPGERKIVARGGRGGQGNMHFATSTRQTPNFARAGTPGEEFEITLELKLLADVGLAGYPNVGKSTLLSVTTGAEPEIANYHFTTIRPNLGVVYNEDSSFVMADIPGLIEGAAQGQGLGHLFLRHIERTRLIIHVLDMAGSEGREPFEDFLLINNELKLYNDSLASRPQIIAANKMDIEGAGEKLNDFMVKYNAWLEEHEEELRESIEIGAWRVFELSAALSHGTRELMAYTGALLTRIPITSLITEVGNEAAVYKADEKEPLFTVNIAEDGAYVIEGVWIQGIIDSTNLADYESTQYFQRLLRKKGVIDELLKKGIKEEDTVRIGDTEFEFIL